MVETVSQKLNGEADIAKYRLAPCRICKPPVIGILEKNRNSVNKAVGEAESVRCVGITQSGSRCKHSTKLANGYCYQHTKQNSTANSMLYKREAPVRSSTCGAKNKSGGYCKRKVGDGGRCYQHK